MQLCHLPHSCYAAMPSIALHKGVGVEVIFRLAASRLAALLYAVLARAAPHANLGHTNNNTVSQSTAQPGSSMTFSWLSYSPCNLYIYWIPVVQD